MGSLLVELAARRLKILLLWGGEPEWTAVVHAPSPQNQASVSPRVLAKRLGALELEPLPRHQAAKPRVESWWCVSVWPQASQNSRC